MAIELTAGVAAPKFMLATDGGGQVTLGDFRGRKLVLYFYPRADTPGCTREAIAFSRLARAFDKDGADILGVSADPVSALDRFKTKHALKIPLGSDDNHKMLKSYGVWGRKSMYGKTFWGVKRTTYLIGADGRIARIWNNVKVDGHAEEVLAAVAAI
jgi:thioredoxin-dependent peroxiredoxin